MKTKLFSLFILFVCFTTFAQVPSYVPTNGLVGYWPFNGNANDVSGNGNNGTVNGATLTTDRNGNTNAAYSFNGSSSYINIANSSIAAFGLQSFSAAAWFKTSIVNGTGGQYIRYDNCVTNSGWGVGGQGIVAGLEFPASRSGNQVQTTLSYSNSQWHLAVFVRDILIMKDLLYIDGNLVAQTSFSVINNLVNTGSPLRFGSCNGYQFYSGSLDDIGIWNRAFTQQEISNLFSSCTPPSAPVASSNQTFCTSDTVANLSATGTAVQWYDAATGGNLLASTTVLTDGQLVYASQIENSCESTTRTAVTVSVNDPQIIASATTVCRDANVNLTVNVIPSPIQEPRWELLIPPSNYNGSQINLSETGYDRNNNYIFSLFKQGSNLTIYRFNLNDNTVSNITTTNVPSNVGPFTYDYTNNRLITGRTGRDPIFAVSASGGAWSQTGTGSFDQESYGAQYYWNSNNQKTGFFGGYGFSAVKNWIWENGGSWTNTFTNNNNCGTSIPAKRNAQLALGALNTNKIYFLSGQGSCSGQQTASSCNLGSPWATDVGIYCWLKDLWELDLNTYTFNNILPVNNNSITKEGGFVYNYSENSFYIIGGYTPSPTYNSNIGNLRNFETSVLKFNPATNSGFLPFSIQGTPPPLVTLNNLGSNKTYFDAANNQIVWVRKDGVWAIKLDSSSNSTSILWSTGETTQTINPAPTTTTTYWVDVTVNGVTCRKEVTITVNSTTPAPTASATQTFCAGTAITVGNLAATGTAVQWYDAATGGNLLASTAALTDGQLVYASQTENSCESTTRTAVTVSVNDPQITASASTVCAGTAVNLSISTINQIPLEISNFSGPYFFNNHTYFKSINSTVWQTAKQMCTSLDGYLAIPNSYEECEFFSSIFNNSTTIHIGITDFQNEGAWLDVLGNPIIYTNWAPSEPNNEQNEDFGQMYSSNFWNDQQGGNFDIWPFILEYDSQTTYLWSTGETTATINPTPTTTTTYWCDVTINGTTCRKEVTITVNSTTPAPTASATQTFCAGTAITVGNLAATGTAVQWYDATTGGNLLASTTALTDGQTIYASQTENSCESTTRTAVTVSVNDPQITASASTVCAGTAVNLSASTTAAGLTANCSLPANLQTGLVGYWPFCGNANDVSGNGNNGTVNGATLTTDRFGNANSAYSFDGMNDFIQCNSVNFNDKFTAEFWYKNSIDIQTSYTIGHPPIGAQILGQGTQHLPFVSYSDFAFGISNYGNAINHFALEFSGPINPQFTDLNSNNLGAYNQWNHVVVVRNGSTCNYFLNGNLVDFFNLNSNLLNTGTPLSIGARLIYNSFQGGNQLTNYFKGEIDNVAIWNRALIASEINQLYNSGQTTYLWSTGETTATINPTPTTTTTYWCDVTVNGTICRKEITITVNSTTPAPTAAATQTFCAGTAITVGNLAATGTAVQWYDAATGGNLLASTTALTDGQLVYASQTENSCESTTRTAVTVSVNDPQITASASTVCAGTAVNIQISNIPPSLSQFQANHSDLNLFHTIGTHSYFYKNQAITWQQAKNYGDQIGVSMYVINDSTEELSVYNSLPFHGVTGIQYWIGLYQDIASLNYSEPSGGWKWVDGSPLNYTNWYVGEPNNSENGESYGQIDWTVTGIKWNDAGNINNNNTCACNISYPIYEFKNLSSYLWSTGETTATINPTPTTTTTYWCDVTVNGTTCRKEVTITVNPNITPTFTQVAPICNGATLAALPTSSTNAITGTWSPAMNNTATTTYTFTPTAGLCATTTTMTITVNPNITPTFTQVAPICNGATLAALPTTSTNGITGTWSPAMNNTATTTYTFTPTAGLCATTTTMTIEVNPNITPTFSQVAPICNGATLAALPTNSTNGITGTWSPAMNNTATTTYTFTPTAGLCATTTTMTITVNPNVTPTFTQVAPICNGATLSALPTSSTNAITGTWSPAMNSTATTTYTFTPTSGLCATTTTMTITVNPTITPTFSQVAPICNGATLAALPTSSTNAITGTWSPAMNNTATTTYTFTPTAGLCATTTTMTIVVRTNVNPIFTSVNPICAGTTLSPLPITSTNGITGIWSPALDNTTTTSYTFTPNAGQCAIAANMTITVRSLPQGPTGDANQVFCASTRPTVGSIVLNVPNLTWYISPTSTIPVPVNTSLVNGAIYYAAVYDVVTGCESNIRFMVTASVSDEELNVGIPNQTFCNSEIITIADIQTNSTLIYWYANPIGGDQLPLNTLLYEGDVIYATNYSIVSGCESSERQKIEIHFVPCEIEINNLITLDGNDLNDNLNITNIENFENNNIEIFNRYGQLVWSTEKYNNTTNTFVGRANVSGVFRIDKNLPTGVYFYILRYKKLYRNDFEELNGYLYISNNQ